MSFLLFGSDGGAIIFEGYLIMSIFLLLYIITQKLYKANVILGHKLVLVAPLIEVLTPKLSKHQ